MFSPFSGSPASNRDRAVQLYLGDWTEALEDVASESVQLVLTHLDSDLSPDEVRSDYYSNLFSPTLTQVFCQQLALFQFAARVLKSSGTLAISCDAIHIGEWVKSSRAAGFHTLSVPVVGVLEDAGRHG